MHNQPTHSSDAPNAGANSKTGVLYVVATPIGNLGDMVPRAVTTLQTVDLIAAEDTRHSSRLMAHFDIKTPMVAYHDHSESDRTLNLIHKMIAGSSIALISDAGTPLVSDPGYQLVRAARAHQIPVIPIPGASALIAALSASGLPSDKFIFEGFLPAKQAARLTQLEGLAKEKRTLIFYEAPHRILETLQDMCVSFGVERQAVVARELTKTFETIHGASLTELVAWVLSDTNQQRGEIVLLVRGDEKEINADLSSEHEKLMCVLMEELPIKQVASLGAKITGLKKNFLYDWCLEKSKNK